MAAVVLAPLATAAGALVLAVERLEQLRPTWRPDGSAPSSEGPESCPGQPQQDREAFHGEVPDAW